MNTVDAFVQRLGLSRPRAQRVWGKIAYAFRGLSFGTNVNPRPIFIMGCPRSGTTMLLHIFRQSSDLSSLRAEGARLWERFHPLDANEWESGALDEHDLQAGEAERIYRDLYRLCGPKRFVEKSARNCLRVPYLRALFPQAFFVCIIRDGRDNVNSLIQGWRRMKRHPSFRLPVDLRIQGYDGKVWKYVLPPGWRAYVDRPLEDVCAFQWVVCNDALLDAGASVAPAQWIQVKYEEIVTAPVPTMRRVFDAVELPFEPQVEEYCRTLSEHPVNYVTKPRLGKWRDENPEAIRRVLPTITPMLRRLGYPVDEPAAAPADLVDRARRLDIPWVGGPVGRGASATGQT